MLSQCPADQAQYLEFSEKKRPACVFHDCADILDRLMFTVPTVFARIASTSISLYLVFLFSHTLGFGCKPAQQCINK